MTEVRPTVAQIREAQDGVASRGWQPSKGKALHHRWLPVAIRDDDGRFHACEHCSAGRQNPARWPLFFVRGDRVRQLRWTCSTCKDTQADEHGVAIVLVTPPRD